MELQIDNQDLPEREKIHFLFALGKAYEDVGDYEKSFKYYDLGNHLI